MWAGSSVPHSLLHLGISCLDAGRLTEAPLPRPAGREARSRLNSERIDSFAPARFGLSACHLCRSRPRGSIREQGSLTFWKAKERIASSRSEFTNDRKVADSPWRDCSARAWNLLETKRSAGVMTGFCYCFRQIALAALEIRSRRK